MINLFYYLLLFYIRSGEREFYFYYYINVLSVIDLIPDLVNFIILLLLLSFSYVF